MRRRNLVQLLKKYPERWVSLSVDYHNVLASGKTMKSLLDQLAKLGNPKGVIIRSAKDYSRYVGTFDISTD